MNASLRVAVLSLSMLGLAACAGTQTKTAHTAAPMSAHPAASPDRDSVYVATVERVARRRGIDVVWVNPPDRRKLARTPAPQP
ncbi:hypothetical protein [Pseudomonas sp. CGJS7]|uniref:hypothetical protein n=1 Tax=Pseudomonas sp. CGJS7 TaxID=3109348 RepID=UPI00300AB402